MTNPILYYGDSLLSPEGSALHQADSTTRGFLFPRMTTTQRNAISAPADGLTVYDTTLHVLYVYENGAWTAIASSGGSGSFLAVYLTGTGGAGFLDAVAQSADPSAPSATGLRLFPNASGYLAWRVKNGSDTFTRQLIGVLTAARSYTLPDYGGEMAVESLTSIATAAGTTTLTASSTRTLLFTGATTQTVKMPPANTLPATGWERLIRNTSTGIVTVQDNSAGAITTLAQNQEVTVICTNIGSAAGAWSIQGTSGTGARVLATSPTIVTPTIAKLANLTTNGYVTTASGDGTLVVAPATALLGWNANAQTVPASSTRFIGMFDPALHAVEAVASWISPKAGTLRNFRFSSTGAQPALGSLVFTVKVAGSTTSITATIAAGGAAQTASDLTHTATVAAGDIIDVQCVNNDTVSVSATLGPGGMQLDYTA